MARSVPGQILADVVSLPRWLFKRLRSYIVMAIDNGLQRQIARQFPATPYTKVLADLHAALKPRAYLEIGVAEGDTLALSRAPVSVGVDPGFSIRKDLTGTTYAVHRETSDAFFARPDDGRRYDMIFVDGMHHFDQALRDILNAEARSTAGAVIAVHDVLPVARIMQTRRRHTRAWTGDVWKVIPALRRIAPDLRVTVVDAPPSGLLLISNLKPGRRLDAATVDAQCAELMTLAFPGAEALRRDIGDALVPPDGVPALLGQRVG